MASLPHDDSVQSKLNKRTEPCDNGLSLKKTTSHRGAAETIIKGSSSCASKQSWCHVHTSPDEYPESFKGIVRTPSVVLGRGLSPNRASGLAAPRPFRPKLSQRSEPRGLGKTGIPPTSTPPCAGIDSTLDHSVSPVHAMWKFSAIEY